MVSSFTPEEGHVKRSHAPPAAKKSSCLHSGFQVHSASPFPLSSVQFSSLTDWVVRGGGAGVDVRDDSAEILLQSFLQEALVSSSGSGRDVSTHPSSKIK